ncbi:MAG: hypothetical protein LAP87_08970 [Acidobacteriia bacterium]|nr:hypothetical protein [Terriglobia bacterium]
MTPFRFPLQKVLDWRLTQLEVEEIRYRQQLAALAALDRTRAELEAAGIRAEVEVRKSASLAGFDLAALGSFRRRVQVEEGKLATRRAECEKRVAAQQSAMLEARRRCRLLERLKERRLTDWQSAADKEVEALAAESFLAQWNRRRA